MKYLITLLTIFMLQSCVTAQTIIDLGAESFSGDTKNGQYYHKDINGYFNDFTGIWKYEYDTNKEFRIILTKVEMYHDNEDGDDYYFDGILITYKKYENGTIVFQSPMDTYPSGIIKEFGKLNMSFTDYERNDEIFPVDLTLISTGGNNQYNLKFKLDRFERRNTYYNEHPDEPYFSVPDNIIMTKM